mgnify:CR=1 FL=1
MAMTAVDLVFRIITFLLLLAPGGEEIGIDLLEDSLPQATLVAYEADDDAVQVDIVGPEMEEAFFTVRMEDEEEMVFSYESADGNSGNFSLANEAMQMEDFGGFEYGEPLEVETDDGDYWLLYPGMAGIYLQSDMMRITFLMAESTGW